MKRTDARPRKEGWRQVAPGIYHDSQGHTHLSVPELLELFEVADTPENRQICIEQAQRAIQEQWPGVPMEVRE